jgi:hypothetical protein
VALIINQYEFAAVLIKETAATEWIYLLTTFAMAR